MESYRPRTIKHRAAILSRYLTPRAVALVIGIGASVALLTLNPMLAAMCLGFTCVVVLT